MDIPEIEDIKEEKNYGKGIICLFDEAATFSTTQRKIRELQKEIPKHNTWKHVSKFIWGDDGEKLGHEYAIAEGLHEYFVFSGSIFTDEWKKIAPQKRDWTKEPYAKYMCLGEELTEMYTYPSHMQILGTLAILREFEMKLTEEKINNNKRARVDVE